MGKRARIERRAVASVEASGKVAVSRPLAARRLDDRAGRSYDDLAVAGARLAALEDQLREQIVPRARAAGVSWSLIGSALGLTGEGARRRYGS